ILIVHHIMRKKCFLLIYEGLFNGIHTPYPYLDKVGGLTCLVHRTGVIKFTAIIRLPNICMGVYMQYGKVVKTLVKGPNGAYGNGMFASKKGNELISLNVLLGDLVYRVYHSLRRTILLYGIRQIYPLLVDLR